MSRPNSTSLSLAGRYRTCPLARHHQRGHQTRHFLFGIGPNAGRIYLVDYGLSRYYQNSVTKKHIVDKPLPYFLGTTCYSSIKAHFLHSTCIGFVPDSLINLIIAPSRCDDMESLAYSVARLLRGELPWSTIHSSQEACTAKQTWSGLDLCAGYPSVFGDFVEYTRSLEFFQTSEYAHWRHAFLEVVPEPQRSDTCTCDYDVSDTIPPLVGKCLSLAPNLTSSLTFAPKSNSQYSDNSLPSSDHGWLGTSTWPNPTQIKDDCVFRDEERLVREWTEHISEPPTKVLPYLQMGHFPETMRTYDTFTSQSPLLLQSFSSSEDSTTM